MTLKDEILELIDRVDEFRLPGEPPLGKLGEEEKAEVIKIIDKAFAAEEGVVCGELRPKLGKVSG